MAPKIIALGSGKGGVGKTTVALNLGFALSSLNKKVIVVDTDISLPNLDIYTGLEKPIITLLDVLNGSADVQSAINTIQLGLSILPCGTSLEALKDVNIDKLEDVIKDLRNSDFDFVILDVPAGLSKFSILPMTFSDEVLLVVNPEPASISDAQKVKAVLALAHVKISGIIINKYKKSIYEDAGIRLGLPVIGVIPEDEAVISARDSRKPLILLKPKSASSKSILGIARKISGIPPKKGFLSRLFK